MNSAHTLPVGGTAGAGFSSRLSRRNIPPVCQHGCRGSVPGTAGHPWTVPCVTTPAAEVQSGNFAPHLRLTLSASAVGAVAFIHHQVVNAADSNGRRVQQFGGVCDGRAV